MTLAGWRPGFEPRPACGPAHPICRPRSCTLTAQERGFSPPRPVATPQEDVPQARNEAAAASGCAGPARNSRDARPGCDDPAANRRTVARQAGRIVSGLDGLGPGFGERQQNPGAPARASGPKLFRGFCRQGLAGRIAGHNPPGLHGARRRRPAPARAQTAAGRQAHPARSSTRRNRCTPT